MVSCVNNVCGLGDVSTPPTTAPNDSYEIYAKAGFGGILVWWTYPTVNPESVKHMQLYRSDKSTLAVGAPIYQIAAGTQFFDYIANDDSTKYYYWLKVVSFDGFVGKLVGPASAMAGLAMDAVMEYLSKNIEESPINKELTRLIPTLVPTLDNYKAYMDQQKLNYDAVTTYIAQNTKATDAAIGHKIKIVEDLYSANEALTTTQEITAVAMGATIAALHTQSSLKIGYAVYEEPVTEWSDKDQKYILTAKKTWVPYSGNTRTPVYAKVVENYYKSAEYITKVKDKIKTNPTTGETYLPIDIPADIADRYYRISTYQKGLPLIIDGVGVSEWNRIRLEDPNTSIAAESMSLEERKRELIWKKGLPLSEVVKQSQVNYKGKDGTTQVMQLEEAFRTQVDINDKLMGQYHVKIQSGGANGNSPMISGFGLASYKSLKPDGINSFDESMFLVNATTFAIGRPYTLDENYKPDEVPPSSPFIVETGDRTNDSGKKIDAGVYINAAFIKHLTFDQIVAGDNSFISKVAGGFEDDGSPITDSYTYAKKLTVDKLNVGNRNGSHMEVTGDVIKIFEGFGPNNLRVRIGNLSI